MLKQINSYIKKKSKMINDFNGKFDTFQYYLYKIKCI